MTRTKVDRTARPRALPVLVLLVCTAAATAACDRDAPFAPPDGTPPDTASARPTPDAPDRALGLVEVTITGIGTPHPSATAVPYGRGAAGGLAGLAGLADAGAAPGAAGVRFNLDPVTSSNALALDGAGDYVNANNATAAIDFTPALTLEAWVRPEAESGAQQAILSFHTTDGDILNPLIIDLNTLLYEPDRDGFAYYDEDLGYVRTGGTGETFPPGRWYHVAVVIDAADQGTLYIDGTPQATFTTDVRPEFGVNQFGPTSFFSIGQEYDANASPSDFLLGRIDEVRVWRVARSEAEIQADMGREIAPFTAGLAAYYRFGEASGTTATDLAGGHDGALVDDAALGAAGPALEGSGDGTIQLEPLATGSFTSGARGAGGMRYLYATFRVRNAQEDGTPYSTARENLTFLATDTDDTHGHTAVSRLITFGGTEITGAAAVAIAEGMIPTGRASRRSDDAIRSVEPMCSRSWRKARPRRWSRREPRRRTSSPTASWCARRP